MIRALGMYRVECSVHVGWMLVGANCSTFCHINIVVCSLFNFKSTWGSLIYLLFMCCFAAAQSCVPDFLLICFRTLGQVIL